MNYLVETVAALFECFVLVRFCNGYLGFKKEKWTGLKSFGVFAALVWADIFSRFLEGFENVSVIVLLLIMIVYSFEFLKGKTWEKILASVIPILAALPIDLIVMGVFTMISGNDRSEVLPGGSMRIPVLFFTKALFFFVCEIVVKTRKKQRHYLMRSQWVLQLSCFLISFQITIFMWDISRTYNSSLFLIIFLLIAALNVILYIIMNKMQNDNRLKEEYDLLKANISSQEKLAVEIRERYSEIRTLKHDMKHYLTTAAELISDDKPLEAKAYIENVIDEKINPSNAGVNTGSAVIDAVINNKIALCTSKGIKMKCAIDTRFENINDIDVSILLSNLLDNAVTGCDPANPYIELVISRKKSLTFISVKNSIAASVLTDNPGLKTDKPDKSKHGYGIRSIRDIAGKYEGSIDFREEGDNFIAEIWLKMAD